MAVANITENLILTDVNSSCSVSNITISDVSSMSLSSFEIIFIAACSSFLTLIFAGLLNYLKINIKQQKPNWIPPPPPNFDKILRNDDNKNNNNNNNNTNNIILDENKSKYYLGLQSFPPHNRFYPVILTAYRIFLESINGTERDGWIYQGEKKGIKRYKKDIHSSPFSLYRGEKILNYPQNLLIHAIRNKKIRLIVGDGQMRDCGPLEIIDDNCKIEFEEYKSPAPFVGAREFVYIDTIHRLNDGTILSFAKSVQHPKRPKTNKFTRANLIIGGWALKKIPDEPNKTKVIYLVRCDLGGSVPSFVINQITADIPMTVERLNVALKKVGDITEFDQPLHDVLLYGPRDPKIDDIKMNENDDKLTKSKSSPYIFPSMNQTQKNKLSTLTRNHGDFWKSNEYLRLIPRDPSWISKKLKVKNGTTSLHNKLIDNFVIPDADFQYKPDLIEAFKLWNTWRKWKNNDDSGWKFKAQKEDLKIYSHSMKSADIDIIKGEGSMPYPTSIVLGILLNTDHRKKWDSKLDELKRISKPSKFTTIVYISVKTPTMFITYRDMIAITFVYPLEDGSVLMGSRSIQHPSHPPKKTRVRANINLDFWHIRPDYDNNINKTLITYYAHVSLGGSLPNYIVNQVAIDMPSGIIKVRNYIKSVYHTLHIPGRLHIPPYPFLKMMGIDIGWMKPTMNIDKNDNKSDSDNDKKTPGNDNENDKKITKNVIISNIKISPNYNTKNKNFKSPAFNYQQHTPSNTSDNNNNNAGSVTSSRRGHRRPNSHLMVSDISNPSRSVGSGGGTNSDNILTPKSKTKTKTTTFPILLTRKQWENGGYLRLNDIKLIKSSDKDNDKGNDDDDKQYKYSLYSNLSVRKSASFITLANYSVSELLNQTDPSSKNYWIPSDASTPRGIFVYKFIHSREKYYHYMGKAILHHSPQFIYDSICDPSFRFDYDKMVDEMQIIDKLDNDTYITRYTHTNKQCYFKNRRETVAVIKHRCVDLHNKYVIAGQSVEHDSFPSTHSTTTTTATANDNNNNNNNDGTSSKSTKSSSTHTKNSSLTGRGPSKSIQSGILRMDIKATGWVIERNVKKPTDSIVSYIININFGGSIPSALLKNIAKKQPLAIFYLGKALKKKAKLIKQKKKLLRKKQLQLLQQQQQHSNSNSQQQQP